MSTVLVPRAAAVGVVGGQDRAFAAGAQTAGDVHHRRERRAILIAHASLLLTTMLWGGNFTATKDLLGRLEPLDLAFLRAVGTALLAVVLLLTSRRLLIPMPPADALRLVAVGLIGITGVTLAGVSGQRLLPATLSSLIVASAPIHIAILSRLLLGERLGGRKIGGTALAFGGLLVVVLFGSGREGSLGGGQFKGVLILSLAPLAWAGYTVLSRPLLVRYSTTHVTAYMLIAGSLPLLTVPLLRPGTAGRMGDLDAAGWGTAGFSALLAGALGYLLWMRGLRLLTPSQAAGYAYLVPVFGLLCARLVLGETITPFLLLGGATILLGLVLTNSGRAGSASGGRQAHEASRRDRFGRGRKE